MPEKIKITDLIVTAKDYEMMDDIIDDLSQTMPSNTEEERKLISKEAERKFLLMMES